MRSYQCGHRNRMSLQSLPNLVQLSIWTWRGAFGWSGPSREAYLCPTRRSALLSSASYPYFMVVVECLKSSYSVVRRTRRGPREVLFSSLEEPLMAAPESRSRLSPLSGLRVCTTWVGHALSPDLGELFPAVLLLSSGPVEGLASVFPSRYNWAHLSSSSFPSSRVPDLS